MASINKIRNKVLFFLKLFLSNLLFLIILRTRFNGDFTSTSKKIFKILKIRVIWDFTWKEKESYVFFGEHIRGGDNLALFAGIPNEIQLYPVISERVAKIFGKLYTNHCICIPSRNSLAFFYSDMTISQKVLFFLSRYTPFKRVSNSHYQKMLEHIKKGKSLSIFPAGIVGEASWKTGVARLLQDTSDIQDNYSKTIKFIGIDIQYVPESHIIFISEVCVFHPNNLNKRYKVTELIKKIKSVYTRACKENRNNITRR